MTLPMSCMVPDDASASRITSLLEELRMLYETMDGAYGNIAGRYGFVCRGCEDNCCRTRFHHHTAIEFHYLMNGLALLEEKERRIAGENAGKYVQSHEDGQAPSPKPLCPLNAETRCILYEYRPMICRLHGIPHELKRPGSQPVFSPGCPDFDRQVRHPAYIPFDRTPLYLQLAELEKKYRAVLKFSGKIKLTVAEMILRGRESTAPD
ncbi:MAG: hypothetical protein ACOZF0_16155 [Thermodesulfobacteriota bacterium]